MKVLVDECYLRELEENAGCAIRFLENDQPIEFLRCAPMPQLNIKSPCSPNTACSIKVIDVDENHKVKINHG